jgi:hypothetical protein
LRGFRIVGVVKAADLKLKAESGKLKTENGKLKTENGKLKARASEWAEIYLRTQ